MHSHGSVNSIQPIGPIVSLHSADNVQTKKATHLGKANYLDQQPTGVRALTLPTRALMIAVVSFLYTSSSA